MHIFNTRLTGGSPRHASMLHEGEGGGSSATSPPPLPPAAGGAKMFTLEYVQELREEAKSWRVKYQEGQAAVKAANDAATKAKADSDAAVAAAKEEAKATVKEARTKADKDVADAKIQSALQTAATKAGMVDIDGLKLADVSAVKINDKGEIEGVDTLITTLKEAKPFLFGQAGQSGTSNTKKPPDPGNSNAPKKAMEMSQEEFDKNMRLINAGKLPA